MKKLFFAAFAALAFAACSDDNYYTLETPMRTIGFESAITGESGYLWGKDQASVLTEDDAESSYLGEGSAFFFNPLYTESDAAFWSFYSDMKGLYGSAYDTWAGFAISSETNMTTEGYTNDKSVYAACGAAGSAQFAVIYNMTFFGNDFDVPTVRFVGAVDPKSVSIANTTYLYLYFNGSHPATVADTKAIVTGYNCGVKTGEVEVMLADAATGTVKNGWESVDLSSLGTVTSLTFTFKSTDSYCPAYYAVDNLVYTK